MLQPSTSPESLLDRAKHLSEEMAMHKQIARKEQKRKLSKLRYNKQREEILIRKKQHYKEHHKEKRQGYQIHLDEKVQQQTIKQSFLGPFMAKPQPPRQRKIKS